MISRSENVHVDHPELKELLETSRYDIDTVLGEGTWGVVVGANDTATGERVALKVLRPTELAKEQMKQRELTPFEAMKREGDLCKTCLWWKVIING